MVSRSLYGLTALLDVLLDVVGSCAMVAFAVENSWIISQDGCPASSMDYD